MKSWWNGTFFSQALLMIFPFLSMLWNRFVGCCLRRWLSIGCLCETMDLYFIHFYYWKVLLHIWRIFSWSLGILKKHFLMKRHFLQTGFINSTFLSFNALKSINLTLSTQMTVYWMTEPYFIHFYDWKLLLQIGPFNTFSLKKTVNICCFFWFLSLIASFVASTQSFITWRFSKPHTKGCFVWAIYWITFFKTLLYISSIFFIKINVSY